ncbi:AMP-binding protein [Staphylococcus lutrae]|uniref:Putative long chain fatty acid-CoA ligase VraA n=1 Tax=Staphylococcus lutrae TaxID=155085 RepID=A0AAC9WIY9_9STAP|nr:AMP-binding protein [Staphylococcus lutrae]ARJ50655.1 hypothetical protein B5P37_04645 [Staphylococcus lutrae]PNZ39125.1 hypothetical protein CD134_02360 [Staphylococcus lutrae]
MKNKILDKFYENVAKNPKQVILTNGNKAYTNMEIDHLSNEISKYCLKSNRKYIPYLLSNDLYVLPTIIGIWKAGKVPIPLAKDINLEEHLLLHKDLEIDDVISDKNLDINHLDINTLDVNDHRQHNFSESAIENEYLALTSGSTGYPKKIRLSENGIYHILSEYYRLIGADKNSKFLFSTSYTFDVSLSEIFAPILLGCQLVCYDENINTVEKRIKNTLKYIERYEITHLAFSPSYLEFLLSNGNKCSWRSVETISVAGEVFNVALKDKLKDIIPLTTHVFNLYGPAKATIFATYYQLKFNEKNTIPIGVPINGVEIKLEGNDDICLH